jgi:uroporphyrinogen decarboxylase
VTKLTVRESFLRCMKFQPVDRVPNWELGYWGQTADRWIEEGMPPEEADSGGFHGHAFFGIDNRPFLPVNFNPIPLLGGEVIEETDRYVVSTDGDGATRKALKEGTSRGTRPSMDQWLSAFVQRPEDLERVKECLDPHAPGRCPDNLEEVAAGYRDLTDPLGAVPNGAFGFYSHMRRFMGTEGLSYAWYDWPDAIHDFLEHLTEFCIETLRPWLGTVRCDYFNFFEDFAFKTGPLVSPPIFREFLLPRYKRITEFIRSQGIDVIWFDSDGNFDPLIPLVMEAGVTCIWPLEVASNNDPREIRRRYGHSLALSGGIDKRELSRDKAAIRAELEAKIPALLEDGGFIPTIDHAIPPDISYDNWLYYLELKSEMLGG